MSWTTENKYEQLKHKQERLQMDLERAILVEEVTKLRTIQEEIPQLISEWEQQFQTLSTNFDKQQKHHQNELSEKIESELKHLNKQIQEQLDTLISQNQMLHHDNQVLLSDYENYLDEHVKEINREYRLLVEHQALAQLEHLKILTANLEQAQAEVQEALSEFARKQLAQAKTVNAIKDVAMSAVFILLTLAVIWTVGYLLGTFFQLDEFYRWLVASTIGKGVLWVLGLSLLVGTIGSVVYSVKN